jgi:hypothetical protein
VVDRPAGLRAGAREVDLQAVVVPGQRDPLSVQARRVDAVVLGVVLPLVGAGRDLGEHLAPERLGGVGEECVEARLDGVAPVAGEQLLDAAGAHAGGSALGVDVAGQAVRHARVAGDDPQHRLVRHAGVVELDRRHHQPLLVGRRGVARHRAGHHPADVVVMAEGLDEGHHLALVEHRDGDAQVRQVPDAALRQVDVVVEVDVARPHRREREIAHHRMHERRVRAPGELAQPPVVDPGPEVVLVADHRRARGAPDRLLHLGLDRRQRALHDLHEHGIDHRRTTTFPNSSTLASKPGWIGSVEPNSWITAGPVTTSPARRSSRR